jgi:hypothetical protein
MTRAVLVALAADVCMTTTSLKEDPMGVMCFRFSNEQQANHFTISLKYFQDLSADLNPDDVSMTFVRTASAEIPVPAQKAIAELLNKFGGKWQWTSTPTGFAMKEDRTK